VRAAEAAASGPAAALTSPLGLVIEGELWGDPFPEQLLIRAVLDLDAGRVEVAPPDGPA
jgi:predicted component of type VI protein secretion system